jgi:hypothetical protein
MHCLGQCMLLCKTCESTPKILATVFNGEQSFKLESEWPLLQYMTEKRLKTPLRGLIFQYHPLALAVEADIYTILVSPTITHW